MGKTDKAQAKDDFFTPELDAGDVFEPSAFQSMTSAFTVIKNLTTRTEAEEPGEAAICEVRDQGICFEVGKSIGAKGHSLMLAIMVTAPSKKGPVTVKFEATASIKSIEITPDGGSRIDVDFVQYEEKGWQKVLSLYSARQEEINQFLSMVKG